jgi:hypothetical protein
MFGKKRQDSSVVIVQKDEWKDYAIELQKLVLEIEKALHASNERVEFLTKSNETLMHVIAGTLTSCAQSNGEVVKAVNNMKGIVAEMARPKIALYANGSSETC